MVPGYLERRESERGREREGENNYVSIQEMKLLYEVRPVIINPAKGNYNIMIT